MLITPMMPVASLLRDNPWAGEVLAWHGVTVDEVDRRLSISAMCWILRLDETRLLRDLAAAARSREIVQRDTGSADGSWEQQAV